MKLNGLVSEFLTRDVNVKSPSCPNATLSRYSNLKWLQSSKQSPDSIQNIPKQISEKKRLKKRERGFKKLTYEARSSNHHWMILGSGQHEQKKLMAKEVA